MLKSMVLILILLLTYSNMALAQQIGVPSEIEELAFRGVAANADWEPYALEFNEVEMVLVPAGCFDMGDDPQAFFWFGSEWIQGVPEGGKQCFEEPFWIDRYEVSNGQFERFGGISQQNSRWTDDHNPRESISWFEAASFCTLREARLPTEAEWEFAARGPDGLAYPWGNDFVASHVVYLDNAENQTAPVGSRPDNASWVGALDLAGNVSEWVRTLYHDYPYSISDEKESADNTLGVRMIRGGSWRESNDQVLRSSTRDGYDEDLRTYDVGFRCMRPY